MINVGEQLVSSYLRYILKCDFIQTNLYTVEDQGEIDVVGINLKKKQAYICEVTIHLTTGLQYVKDKRPNNINKLTEKFSRDIKYAKKYLAEYEHHFMLWSPIVKNSQGVVYNQMAHLEEVKAKLKALYGVELECIVNEKFQACLRQLREFSTTQTAEVQCPLVRLLQIEAYLDKHVKRVSAKQKKGLGL